MPWVDLNDMLNHAYRNHYAVGSFTADSVEHIGATLAAAETCRSPVILSLSERPEAGSDFGLIAAAAERAAQGAAVPVALQFERSMTIESAIHAINQGCNGIQATAASGAFPADVAYARTLVDMAHGCGVAVEGELAHPISKSEAPGSPSLGGVYTAVEEAKAFVQRTQVDCLMVSIGTGNGRSRGRLRLDLERLKRIHDAVQVPLAIRTDNGFADEQCHKLLQHGVARVHFTALLEDCASGSLRTEGRAGFGCAMRSARNAMQAEVEQCLHRLGSAGRAAEVLVQCRAWRPIQHVIVYNVEGATDAQVEVMMARGREALSRIPGVRRVFTGWAVPERPRFRFCWLVEMVHEKVIESYREHPEHVAFANQMFRPIAGDRVSVDFVDASPGSLVAVPTVGERARA